MKLRAENLVKTYKKRSVVKGISVEVNQGEIVGLLGPNGAGKTTSFYMIVGLVPLDGGSILLDGEKISGLPIHRRARRSEQMRWPRSPGARPLSRPAPEQQSCGLRGYRH